MSEQIKEVIHEIPDGIVATYIKERRPGISKSSLKTYESILRNLHNKIWPDVILNDMELFETDSKKVLDYLKNMEPKKRKTVLSALVVITDNKDYRTLMLDDIKEYNKEEAKQQKTEKQKENWVSETDLNRVYGDAEKYAKLLYKKKTLTVSDLQHIQTYIILTLFCGKFIPPRRSKDYVNFKIDNIEKDKDNYMDKNEFVFNSYKTNKTYGQQKVEIPITLKRIINKWIKVNPTDYLLFDTSFKQLSNVKLNQRLNKIFGKKAGVNQMRKTFLTDKYANLIDIQKNLEKDMKDMGSSTLQEKIYIKS